MLLAPQESIWHLGSSCIILNFSTIHDKLRRFIVGYVIISFTCSNHNGAAMCTCRSVYSVNIVNISNGFIIAYFTSVYYHFTAYIYCTAPFCGTICNFRSILHCQRCFAIYDNAATPVVGSCSSILVDCPAVCYGHSISKSQAGTGANSQTPHILIRSIYRQIFKYHFRLV